MITVWMDQLNIACYLFCLYYNPYVMQALVWGGVDLLEKFLDSVR